MSIVVATVLFASGVVVASHAGGPDLSAVGPVSNDNGYPVWYRDAHGTEVELCLEFNNPFCGFLPGDIPTPTSPISFPDNFPGEAFWWAGESAMDSGTDSALLVMAVEAAFASGEVALDGDQISFGRVRIRLDGLVPDADYVVTHPYGVTPVVAEPDGSVFVTQDIGALTTPADFSQALDSPVLTGLLEWDTNLGLIPDDNNDSVPDYLGNPDFPNTVTGSPEGTNFFRIEGPDGSFSGFPASEDCSAIGSPGSCIESDQFFVMGKRAVTSGVEAVRAGYVNPSGPSNDYVEVHAKSRPGQTLEVSGSGIGTVTMLGSGDSYFAKIFVDDVTLLTDLVVTNRSDDTWSPIEVTDFVTITSAEYDVDTGYLTVEATSSDSDSASAVTLIANPGGEITSGTLNVHLPSAPLDVTVISSSGGTDTQPVRLVGADFARLDVVAAAIAAPPAAIPGQIVTLDGTGSTGDIDSYAWSQLSGTSVTINDASLPVANFVAPETGGLLEFELEVTGIAGSDTASTTVTVNASDPPVADAGTGQDAIVGEIVTLDGSESTFSSHYEWTQLSGPSVVISNDTQPVATFQVPAADLNAMGVPNPQPLEFELTTGDGPLGASGTNLSTSEITIMAVPDVITTNLVELRTRRGRLRVEGFVSLFSVSNVVSIYEGDDEPGISGALIGTANVDPIDGSFAFRLNRGASLIFDTVDITSSRDGFLTEVAVNVRR